MQNLFNAMYTHLYSYMIPICLLCVYRIVVCFFELAKIKSMRDKQGRFRSSKNQYTEIYCFAFALVGGILTCLLRKLWFVFIPLTIILGVIGGKLGVKKGREIDELWRDVAEEMRKMEAAELENEDRPALQTGGSGDFWDSVITKEDVEAYDKRQAELENSDLTAPGAEE